MLTNKFNLHIWSFTVTSSHEIIAYPTTSHAINPISHNWLLDKYFILLKGNFKQNKMFQKEPGHGTWQFIQWPSANQNTTNFLEVE